MSIVLHSFLVSLDKPSPPSVNEMYTVGFHGKRVLTRKGVIFKDALTSAVAEEVLLLGWKRAVDAVYDQAAWIELTIGLHVSLYNKSWHPGRTTTSKKHAKVSRSSPYKREDATSYIKVVEDAVVDGTGIDDSCHLDVRIRKIDGPRRIEVGYEVHQRSKSLR